MTTSVIVIKIAQTIAMPICYILLVSLHFLALEWGYWNIAKYFSAIWAVILVPLYFKYGRYYVRGMAEYAKDNNTGPEQESCLTGVYDESVELLEAIRTWDLCGIFSELGDVISTITKLLAVNLLPEYIYTSQVFWFVIFLCPHSIFNVVKHGIRYKNGKCIRNHDRPNEGHKCFRNLDD